MLYLGCCFFSQSSHEAKRCLSAVWQLITLLWGKASSTWKWVGAWDAVYYARFTLSLLLSKRQKIGRSDSQFSFDTGKEPRLDIQGTLRHIPTCVDVCGNACSSTRFVRKGGHFPCLHGRCHRCHRCSHFFFESYIRLTVLIEQRESRDAIEGVFARRTPRQSWIRPQPFGDYYSADWYLRMLGQFLATGIAKKYYVIIIGDQES